MIFVGEDDDFRLRRQQAFEMLRQGHAGKPAAHDDDLLGKLWHDSFRQFIQSRLSALLTFGISTPSAVAKAI